MITVSGLPARDRKAVYYVLSIVAAFAVYLLVMEPLWSSYLSFQNKSAQLAGMVQRYSELIENAEQSKGQKNSYESEFRRIVKASFTADTEALATGQMAQAVRDMARRSGIQLKTSRPEKPESSGKLQVLNLSVAFETSLSGLAGFLKELDNHQKVILVREAKISSQKQEYADDEPERLSVKLLITGLRYLPSAAPES